MKKLMAVVRYEKGNVHHVTGDYANKKQFKEDLKGNGYTILAVYTSVEIENIKNMSGYELDTIQKQYVREVL